MIDAISVRHHEYIDASLWFGTSTEVRLLILHNERGVFLQQRVDSIVGPQWFERCRTCGCLVVMGHNYQCTSCMMESLTEKIKVMANIYRERIYRLARQIPKGRVMTYGQIAEVLDNDKHRYTAQTVGWAMHALGDTDCWARVINASGGCSTGKVMVPGNKQQFILEQEGVVFNDKGKCDLETFLWIPDEAIAREARDWDPEPSKLF